MRFLYHSLLVLVAGCAACAVPAQKTRAPATVAPAPPPRRDDWAPRTWEDKYDLMTGFVLPEMSVLFQRHYGQKDPVMTCLDCHGDNAEQIEFRMPNDLPALDPAHMPADHAPEVHFMTNEVTPKMQQLLGKPAWDATTRTGFGCFSCHPTKRS